MALEQSSVSRGIDPKVAHGLAPEVDAPSVDKARYSTARFAAQNDHYVGLYKTWTKALNFLIGEQWRSRWDGTSLSWMNPTTVPPWRQQPMTNITYAVYRTALAKLTKQKPSLEVVPPSGDSEDQESAQLGEALLTYLWRYLKKPQKLPLFIGWLLVTSLGFLRIGWDPEAGELKPRTVPVPRRVPRATSSAADTALGADDASGADDTTDATDGAPDGFTAQAEGGDGTEGDAEDEEDLTDVAADEQGNAYRVQGSDGTDAIDYDREPDQEPTGEITFTVISPLAVRFNPEATSIDDAEEVYVGTVWSRARAAEHFGIREEDLPAADESQEQRSLYEDLVSASTAGFPRSWQDQTSIWGVSQEGAIGARVLVVEYYRKPCRSYPRGRHWISCGAKMLWPAPTPAEAKKAELDADPGGEQENESDFPKGEAELPFGFWPPLVIAVDTPIPGQPSGVGLLTQIVPLNEQLNTLDGKISEKHAVDAMGGIWIASPEDKGVFKPTSEPGQVQWSNAFKRGGTGYAPHQAKLNGMPEPVYAERQVIMSKIQSVAGMSSGDLSQKPEGTPSGRALLVTQETSDAVLMPTLVAIEHALEECGRRELVIAQAKYRDTRLIRVEGEEGQWLFRKFRGADLRDGHDVRVQVGSSFPWSKSAQWDTRLQFLQAIPGLVINEKTGQADKAALAKYMEPGAPGLVPFSTEEDPDMIEIRREHLMFEQFDPDKPEPQLSIPQVAFWQNHVTHLKEHYDFMKRNKARFSNWHPLAQQAFIEHMQLTQMTIEKLAGQIVDGAMPAAPGGGGAPGAPGAPGGAPASAAPLPGAENGPPSPTGPESPPAAAGAAALRIVRPESQTPGPGQARLTRADRASAQHQ